jgi:G protein-coupled receptor GPR1
MFIFRGEQGLYPYRKAAYALAAILPVVMASLAFIEGPGYVNTGQFCYLPFNPMWKRLALSWIPRYLAFAIILFLCIGIYIYVRVLMSRFGAGNESSKNTLSKMSGFDSLEPITQPVATVPPTPIMTYHGLIPSSNASRRNSFIVNEDRPTRPSLSTLNSFNLDMPGSTHASKLHSARMARRGSAQIWIANYGTDLTSQTEQAEVDSQNSTGTTRCDSDDVVAPTAIYTKPELQNQAPAPPVTRPSFKTRNASFLSTTGPSPSIPNLFTILNRKPTRPQSAENHLVLTQSDINAPGTVKTREKILRQLRLLFIYPIVYVVIWILPFIVQLTGYGKGAPYGMRLASIVFLCFHGLADSLVFCLKEKPWRHSQAYNQIFKRFNLRFWKKRQEAPDVGARVGRTREEMTLDSRFAKKRREQEQAEWEMERQAGQETRRAARDAPEWWDRDD